MSPLSKHHLSESEFSLSEECASTCASRSSRLTVKGCNQTGMPCIGSSSCVSSSWFTVPRGSACHDLSASVSRMHACHFESLLDLIVCPIFWNNWTDRLISMLKTNCCWNVMTVLMQREVLSCPLYKSLSSHIFGQS